MTRGPRDNAGRQSCWVPNSHPGTPKTRRQRRRRRRWLPQTTSWCTTSRDWTHRPGLRRRVTPRLNTPRRTTVHRKTNLCCPAARKPSSSLLSSHLDTQMCYDKNRIRSLQRCQRLPLSPSEHLMVSRLHSSVSPRVSREFRRLRCSIFGGAIIFTWYAFRVKDPISACSHVSQCSIEYQCPIEHVCGYGYGTLQLDGHALLKTILFLSHVP